MTETSRPTALGVARSRFVEGLPRKSQELRGSLALLVGSPGEERTREELRRRLHALWASAQVFQIEALSDALKDAIARLDAARDEKRALTQDDLDGLAALAATLPLLGAQTPPVQHALASSPPAPGLLRTSAEFRRTGVRPPSASRVSMPAAIELETLYVVGAVGNLGQRVKASMNDEARIEFVVGESPSAVLDACGPDVLLIVASEHTEALRRAASRIGTAIRVIGGEGVGSLPAVDADGFARALKMALRTLPELETHHASMRMGDLEVQLKRSTAPVRTRFDGMSATRLVDRVREIRPSSTVRLRDAHDAIEAEVRGGVLADVIRTMSDGAFVRGPKALVPFLGMRRGLLTVETSERSARVTLKDAKAELETARLHLAAVAHAAHPSRVKRVHEIVLDDEAAPAARKERAVESRVLDAVTRTRRPSELIAAGTSEEGVSAAVVALARAGAVTGIHGSRGEDLLAESLEVVRALPLEEEPDVRTLTAVPPAPSDEPELEFGESSEEDEDDYDDEEEDAPSSQVKHEEDAPEDEEADDAAEQEADEEDETDDAADDAADDASEEESDDDSAADDTTEITTAPVHIEPAKVPPPPTVEVPKPVPVVPVAKSVASAPEMKVAKVAETARVISTAPEPKPESKSESSSMFITLIVVVVFFVGGYVLWSAFKSAGTETPVTPTVAVPQTPVAPTVEPSPTPTPPVEEEVPAPEPPAPASAWTSFGEPVPNPEPPNAGTGWILAGDAPLQVEVEGTSRTVPAGGQLAVSLGMHQVTFEDESLRFVVVREDQAVRVSAPR